MEITSTDANKNDTSICFQYDGPRFRNTKGHELPEYRGQVDMNNIIFVGIDGTGKTPLIQCVYSAFVKLLSTDRGSSSRRFKSVHKVQLVPNPFETTRENIITETNSTLRKWCTEDHSKHLWLYDRFPIPDEYVYGEMSDQELDRWVERIGVNALYVYLQPTNLDDYLKHKLSDPDPLYPVHERQFAEHVLSRYQQFFSVTYAPVITIGWHPGMWFDDEFGEAFGEYIANEVI
jgi:hypothetical protein